ncbi:MAG TPA: M3 family oligoendopeptidase [Anaerolineales bacterium]|nr:M3 family oligoendopeptidase [Anaerolineales bacterium]
MDVSKVALERWSLDDLFPGLETTEYEQGRQQLEAMLTAFEGRRSELSEALTPERLFDLLQEYDSLQRQVSRFLGYAHLKFAEDTQDPVAQTMRGRADQVGAEIGNRTLFFTLWWKGLPEARAEALMAAAGDFRQWLVNLRREAPFTLSEPEERVINLKDVTGRHALVTLYDTLTNRYSFRLAVDGEVRELTRGELEAFRQDPRPEVREASYREMLRVYAGDERVLGQLYQSLVRDWRNENVGLRNFESPLAARNLANDLPDEVVETLLTVCREKAGVFQRFFRVKARTLGLERLRRYDLYAPVGEVQRTFPFEDAVREVLAAFEAFHPDVAAMASRVLMERHFDGEVRKGKRSGAFCATIEPALTPWILQSYQGRPRDIATLAHELGHAVHSLLAADHSALTQDATLPLAETASTFGEMLLIDRLLERDPDPEVRRALLFRQMDDNYATIMRQGFFAIFEKQAHDQIQQGAEIEKVSEMYLGTLQEQFGDSLDLSDDFRSEWLAIPHFYHTPFYVYAYSFGQLLVLSLYQQYREEGRSFIPRYLELLRTGGSESPMGILGRAGIDVRDRRFWEKGFSVLEKAVGELEAQPAA